MPNQTESATDIDLLYIVEYCVTENPEEHPDKFYMKLLPESESTMDFSKHISGDIMRINLKNNSEIV